MTHRSRRGAARVNVIWMVVVIVAFFAALGLLFATSSEASDLRVLLQAQTKKTQVAEDKYVLEFQKVREISELIGYYDTSEAAARSETSAMEAGLEQFKSSFPPTMGADVATFQDALGRAIPSHRQLAVKITDLEQELAQKRAEVEQKDEAMTQLTASKDSQIRDLTSQLTDLQTAANTKQNELEQQVAAVRSTLGDTETDLTRVRGEMDDVARAARDRNAEHEARNKELGRKLEVFHREPESPDGKLLAVSKDLGIAWINLGKRNRLFNGMAFTIVSGTPGTSYIKANCEVIDVQDEMSEIRITNQRDPFDPPTAGDLIFNPLYDPRGGRNAVMLGRFSGTYNAGELQALLSEININIQEKLDKTTDFLIVGSETYTDENGDPLDEPLQPSDTPVYKEAEAMGVQIVPVKIVRDFFRRTSL